MSGEITARDRVWAAVMDTQPGRFTVSDVRRGIEHGHRPSEETIRRVLRAATELGVVEHSKGSKYYQKDKRLRNRYRIN